MQNAVFISCGVYPSLQPNVAVAKVTFWTKPLTGGIGVEQLMASSPLESERHSREGFCRYISCTFSSIYMYTLNRTDVEIRIRIPDVCTYAECCHCLIGSVSIIATKHYCCRGHVLKKSINWWVRSCAVDCIIDI